MAEDEVVRDFKKSLSRSGSQQARGLQNDDFQVRCQRSPSLPELAVEPLFPELGRASDIAQPGGFRREHVLRHAPNAAAQRPLLDSMLDPRLQHYFAKSIDLQAESSTASTVSVGASNLSTVLVILKSTVGGTLIIIPGAFSRTGILLAPLELIFIGGIEIYCMVLLVRCVRTLGGGTYGDIARRAIGPLGSWAVDVSILLSQTGFVCSEMLYVALNCHGALKALNLSSPLWSEVNILLLQLLVVIPMSWIRQLKYFQISNLIANTTVLLALAILLAYAIIGLAGDEVGHGIELAGPNWMVFAGTVVFSFECINFVIPMYDAHEQKDTFAPILVVTLCGVCCLFIVFGAVNYMRYGEDTRDVITLNLPKGTRVGRVLPFAFALASLFNVPLFLFPAAAYLETLLFGDVSAPGPQTLLKINGMRTLLICACAIISVFGKDRIDAFVSLIGSFCCVPLAFIFPIICYVKICKPGKVEAALDGAVLLLGAILFVYTSWSAVQQLTHPAHH
ncbi:avt3 [Symbiodinium natans]|uniref:Avt3 protein n=1 Tax=Symbiodinium natans TaxID=878477 RepID=A0A812IN65_9DINO|nr:avt3 [Symbiodinium natans]